MLVEKHDEWKFTAVVEDYIDHSVAHKNGFTKNNFLAPNNSTKRAPFTSNLVQLLQSISYHASVVLLTVASN